MHSAGPPPLTIVQPGEGRVAQCLKQHEAELSAECKAHHAQERGGKRK